MRAYKGLAEQLLTIKDYGISIVNSRGIIMSWNLGAAGIYGYTEDEVVNKHISFFYTSEEKAAGLPDRHLEIARAKGIWKFEGWRKNKNEDLFYANVSYAAFFNNDDSLSGYTIIFRDSTVAQRLALENKLLNERLEDVVQQRTKELAAANAELEAFSYSVSHDLRTPLRAISGYSEMLKDSYGPQLDQEASRIISNILYNTSKMGQLIDDLLAFSRMGRLVSISTSVDMEKLVTSCLDSIGNGSLKVPATTVLPLAACTGDPGMIRQVWMNLIDNAFKYASKSPEPAVEIGCIPGTNSHVYYVSDNGVGFDMKYYGKLFGVFQRLHRQDEFPGTGLGLALAKRIINKHGGEIWGESSLDRGAKFFFSLPAKTKSL